MQYAIGDYIIHGIYFFAYGFVKYIPSPIGDCLRYGVNKFFVRKMGRVRIYEGVTLWYPYRIRMGSNVSLNEWCYISGYGNVSIGNYVRIGNRSTILSSDHSFEDKKTIAKQPLKALSTVIEDDVFIGSSVVVLGGVHIGEHSVIGAGAIVTHDVPPYSVACGNPARVIRRLD